MNAAATWSYDLINARGNAMGKEHRGKGIDVQLGPVAGIPIFQIDSELGVTNLN